MTVWLHLPTIFRRRLVLQIAGLLVLCVVSITMLTFSMPAHAATGVNKTLNFQGRLLTASGGLVPDGYYNIQFKLYQDGSGTAAGDPDGTLKWTETYTNNGGNSGIQVKNGYFSVTLGSKTPFGTSIDWNQDTLWLSMNVAGASASCTTFGTGSCPADGEMLPMKQLTATPYALNAGMLDGHTAADFLQSSSASIQAGSLSLDGTIQSSTSLLSNVIDATPDSALSIGATNATTLTLGSAQSDTTIAGNAAVNGTLTTNNIIQSGSSSLTTGTGAVNLNGNVTVATGQSLTLVGGGTDTRPSNPTDGTMYYDTDTKQLLVYSNGKWQSESSSTSTVVAASNSTQAEKDAARYVATGNADQAIINQALTTAAGGTVYLMPGTYTVNGSILVPNNTTLAGSGASTIITIPDSLNTTMSAVTNATTGGSGTGVTIKNLDLEGNSNHQIPIYGMDGIDLNGSGASTLAGSTVTNVTSNNWTGNGIYIIGSSANNTVYNSHFTGNKGYGVRLNTDTGNTVSGNTVSGNTSGIGLTNSMNNVVKDNTLSQNASYSIILSGSSTNVISNNTISDSGSTTSNNAVYLNSSSSSNTITDNTITDSSATTTNYAITISDAGSTSNTLTGNTIGAGTVNDLGTTTIYAGQSTNSTSFSIQPAGNLTIGSSTTTTTVAGNLQTNSLDGSTTGSSVAIGATNAAALTIGNAAATTTIAGNAVFNGDVSQAGFGSFSTGTGSVHLNGSTTIAPSENSTAALQVQNKDGAALLSVDTSNNRVVIGSGSTGDTLVLDSKTTEGDPTGINGAMYYNSTSGGFRCYQAGAWQDCASGALYTTTSDATALTGSLTTAQPISTTYTMPANYCTAGRVIHLSAAGLATEGATTAQSIAFSVYLGSTQLTNATNTITPSAGQTVGWNLDYSFTCRAAPSASSAIYGQGTVSMPTTASGANIEQALTSVNNDTVNVATNTAQTITIKAALGGTTSSANTLTLKQMLVNSY